MDKMHIHLERQGLIKNIQHDFVLGKMCFVNLIGFLLGSNYSPHSHQHPPDSTTHLHTRGYLKGQ